MNNETIIIDFGLCIIWRILEISESVIRNTLLDLHNSSDDTQPHPIIVNYNITHWWISEAYIYQQIATHKSLKTIQESASQPEVCKSWYYMYWISNWEMHVLSITTWVRVSERGGHYKKLHSIFISLHYKYGCVMKKIWLH